MTLKTLTTKQSAVRCTDPREPRAVPISLPSFARQNKEGAYYHLNSRAKTDAMKLHRHCLLVPTRRRTRDHATGLPLHLLATSFHQSSIRQPWRKPSFRNPGRPLVHPAALTRCPRAQVMPTGVSRQASSRISCMQSTDKALRTQNRRFGRRQVRF